MVERLYSPVILSDATGVSFIDRIAGQLQKSDDGGATFSPLGAGGGAVASLLAADPALIEMAAINALGLGLTAFRRIPIGVIPQTSTTIPSTNDGAIEGMGRKSSATGGSVDSFGASIFQGANTGVGAISFRAKMLIPTAAHKCQIGLTNAAATHILAMFTDVATDATKPFIIAVGAGTTNSANQTIAADNNFHWYRLAWSASTVSMYIDGVLNATINKTNVVSEPLYPYMSSLTTAGDVVVSNIVYGFVAP